MKFLLCALALLPCFHTAHADDIDDRIKGKIEREDNETRARVRGMVVQDNYTRMGLYNAFAARHGGLAKDGTCSIDTERCEQDRYNGGTNCMWWDHHEASYSSLDPNGNYALRSCRLTFRDGLACILDKDYENSKLFGVTRYKADCYDPAGNYTLLSVGSVGGGSGGGKAKRRRK